MRRYEVTDFLENDKKSTNEFNSRHLASILQDMKIDYLRMSAPLSTEAYKGHV